MEESSVMRVLRRQQRGNVAAEVALTLPILLFIMLGLIDLGRGLACKAALGYAARAGTRYASVRSSTSQDPATLTKITNYVRDRVEGLDPSQVSVTANWVPANTRGSRVQVNLTYTFAPIIPFVPEAVQLTSSSQVLISN